MCGTLGFRAWGLESSALSLRSAAAGSKGWQGSVKLCGLVDSGCVSQGSSKADLEEPCFTLGFSAKKERMQHERLSLCKRRGPS